MPKTNTKKDLRFVKYVVNRYLNDKPELKRYREDMVQEGYLGLLKAQQEYDPSLGYEGKREKLFYYYHVKNSVLNYLRTEVRNFTSGSQDFLDYEGPYWETHDVMDPEDIPAEPEPEIPPRDIQLYAILDSLDLTAIQINTLREYLDTGCYAETARRLGVSRQEVRRVVNRVIALAQDKLDSGD